MGHFEAKPALHFALAQGMATNPALLAWVAAHQDGGFLRRLKVAVDVWH
jgi:hypothetical protein